MHRGLAGLLFYVGIACGESPSPCARYEGLPAYDWCQAKAVSRAPDLASVRKHCEATGRWRPLCLHRGALAHHDRAPLSELLELCAGVPDCTFELLDLHPSPEPLTQLALCDAHTQHYAADCAAHTLHRWYAAGASASPGLAAATEHSELIGRWLGAAVACGHQSACPEGQPTTAACLAGAAEIAADPSRCPRDPHGAPAPGR